MPFKDKQKKAAYDRELRKKSYAANPDFWKDRNLLMKYGIGIEEFRKMEAEQNGKCGICGGESNGKGALHVDHDHETGRIRGLLCYTCNAMLGYSRDKADVLRKAADYLENK